MAIGDFVVAALMMAVVAVLVTGVVLMGIGGKTNAKYGNRLMVARVALQAMVLLVLALMFMMGK